VHAYPSSWKSSRGQSTPRILCANHPSSFLDSILVATVLPFKLNFLARGDAFTPWFNRFLRKQFRMMPVWRKREGMSNVHKNYDTFELCLERWKNGDSLIIFSEGLCVQEWKLRPLVKGSARLVLHAVQAGIPLEITPVGINYGHFHGPGKAADLRFGVPVRAAQLLEELRIRDGYVLPSVHTQMTDAETARWLLLFNRWLSGAMRALVVHADHEYGAVLEAESGLFVPKTSGRLWWLFLARILHAPLYFPLRRWIQHLCRDTVHFDSVLFTVLMLTYPLYLLVVIIVLWNLAGGWLLLAVPLWPLSARLARRGNQAPLSR
jgi:hypothetical protein